ncbi:DUF3137 domain-containing protein [Sulfurimonas sp. HSL3-7]|uniref:DUF3137 domain-containing protein n=1 Tax=Sulfonitrofixus jiaomeiensis TaxID=3131938 RepID=UPI0031F7A20C
MKNRTKIYNYFTAYIEPKFYGGVTVRDRQRIGSLLFLSAFLAVFVMPFVWAGVDVYTGSFDFDEVFQRSTKIFFIGFPSLFVIWFLFLNEKNIIRTYQNKVVTPLLREWDASLVYEPMNGVSHEELLNSKFIWRDTFTLQSNNLIYIQENDSRIKLAYAVASHSIGGTGGRSYTDFEGLFTVVENSFHTDGSICILSTAAQRHFGYLGKGSLHSHHKDLKKILMDDPSFDKHYAVYTDNGTATGRILRQNVWRG